MDVCVCVVFVTRVRARACVCVFVGFVMCGYSSATLTGFFRAFSLSYKANAKVKLAKTGHGPHSF